MRAKKNLGQNFLIDQNVINKISECINATENDLIIEIGPGMGALTKKLKTKSPLICYEIDTDLKIYLNSLEDDKTKIIYEDILNTNIKDDIKDFKYEHLFIVGNLPYYITTPIIKHLINLDLDIDEMYFMVQDEVANRYSATYGSSEYGSITLYLKYFFNIEKLFKVSKNSFNPVPKVESAILKFTKRDDQLNVNKDHYFRLINDAFKMKRKTLKNNLKEYDLKVVDEILQRHYLNDTIRAEELSEAIFAELSNSLFERNKNG